MKPPANAMSRYVALLRGINVGGRNMLPMRALAAMFVGAECRDVSTYIQSGNIVFTADANIIPGLSDSVAMEIEAQFGFHVPLVIRSAYELQAAITGNPFLNGQAHIDQAYIDMLHVCFLADLPDPHIAASLDAGRSAPDEFALAGREIYMRLPNGMARTKLTNAYFDSKLKTVSTMRNWRTVLKLGELTA